MLKRYTTYRVAKDLRTWEQERIEPVLCSDMQERDDATKAIRLARRYHKKDPNSRYVVECWWVYRLENEEAHFDRAYHKKHPVRHDFRCTIWDSDTQPT